jgi:threonine synthase
MAHVQALRCRECGRTYDLAPIYTCEWCFGPLEIAYDYEAIAASVSRESIAAGPPTIWRYAALLPVDPPGGETLPVGWTPLVRADRLAAELGLGELWLKDDTRNPTNAFKDRVVAVAIAKALEFGLKTIACASTGNLANAVAAQAARAGLRSFVFIPSDLEAGKVVTTSVYGGTVVAIDGTYDDVNRLCAELASERSWAFVNVNVRPFYAEGSKTLAFETVEQLGWQTPDHVVVPVASGSLLTKIRKGFDELHEVGLLDEAPAVRVSGAQASGCSPVATAFAEGTNTVRPVKPDTIAKSLAIGNPADGPFAVDAVRETGGGFAAVSDEEIVDGIRLLARTEGIFGETAAGVTVATLRRLTTDGVVRPDERVVAYVTGHGLKTLDAVAESGPDATITPTIESFDAAFPASRED